MNRGLYIGATSLVASQRRMDVLSNNLANINTAGYKKDISLTESFPEKLLAKVSRTPEMRNITGANNITYENNGETHTARTEQGYFIVNTNRGKSYVKEIKFIVDDEGFLKTYYKTLDDVYKTDHENYIVDPNGNRIQGQDGDMENLVRGLIFTPPPYVIGTMSGGVRFQKIFTDFTNSGLMDTGGKLDLGLKGNGFFKISGDDEVLYSRNGSFAITDGYLTDLDGRRVLGINGEIPLNHGLIDILANGDILIDDNFIDRLDIVDIDNKEFLRKRGDNLYYMAENVEPEEMVFSGEVLQGYLETSNMNPISGMVEMITLLREFEANQKVVKMQDEMLEKAANEIGRL